MMWQLVLGSLLMGGVAEEPYRYWSAEQVEAKALPASNFAKLSADDLMRIVASPPTPPYRDATVGVKLADGTLWIGTSRGLMRLAPGAPRWRLFHSRRYLPSDHVNDLAVDADGAVWVQTPAGIARLVEKSTTLDAKMAAILKELRARHLRDGLVGAIHGSPPGKPSAEWTQDSDDNDGLWTSLYVAAEAFRYGATGAADAKQNAWESLKALMFLEEVTGISGFAARSFVPAAPGFDANKRYGG